MPGSCVIGKTGRYGAAPALYSPSTLKQGVNRNSSNACQPCSELLYPFPWPSAATYCVPGSLGPCLARVRYRYGVLVGTCKSPSNADNKCMSFIQQLSNLDKDTVWDS